MNWVQAAADIEGVGEQSVRRLWALGLVRSLPELYRLTKEQLLEVEGYGEISATSAIESIEASKQVLSIACCWADISGRRLGDGTESCAALRERDRL